MKADRFARIDAELDPWIESLRLRGLRPRTLFVYRDAVHRFVRFVGDKRPINSLREIRERDVRKWQSYLAENNYAPITQLCLLCPIRSLFRWCQRTGRVFLNPCEHLMLRMPPRRLYPVPSAAAMKRLLDAIPRTTPSDLRDVAFLETAYSTGMRVHEMVDMNVDDIDLENGIVRIAGKGGSERLGMLNKSALGALRQYLHESRPTLVGQSTDEKAVWISSTRHGRFGRQCARDIVKRRGATVGLQITPHTCRRAFATHLYENGASIWMIRNLLGHSSFRHVAHYVRSSPDNLKRAHAASRLSR